MVKLCHERGTSRMTLVRVAWAQVELAGHNKKSNLKPSSAQLATFLQIVSDLEAQCRLTSTNLHF